MPGGDDHTKRFGPPRGQNLDAGRIHSAQADKDNRGPQKQRFWGRIPTDEELMIASDTAEIVSKL